MSTTNGWDAVCAMSLPQVNALLFQQYLRHGPTGPAMPLRLMFDVQPQYWILDVVLGPPELSFNVDKLNATLTMELVRGSLIAFDANQVVQYAIRMRPKESKLTGPLSLATVDVKDTLGSLVVDLGATAYEPEIKGVDPNTLLNTALGTAVANYFKLNETRFPIGTVAPAQVPASLQPTDFKFAVQQKPASADACVLLLIQTNGPAGAVQALANYPIPDHRTAALLISGQAVFGHLMVDYLNNGFASLGAKFQASQTNGAWTVVGSGGTIGFGQIGEYNDQHGNPWSSDVEGYAAGVSIPVDGVTVSISQGSLSVNWISRPNHYWTWNEWEANQYWPHTDEATLDVSYSLSSKPKVDPVSDLVSFPDKGHISVNAEATDWLENALGQHVIPDVVVSGIRSSLQTFDSFQLPSVNTFALANLLFPSEHVISLSDVALSGDLNLTGTMVTPIAVTPANSAIAPGATVQFTAEVQAGGVTWENLPRVGSISASGLYTAPATIDEATVVVVTAVSNSDANKTGSAMVLVFESAAAQGVDVSPSASIVTPGQSLPLSFTNAAGQSVPVDTTLSPNLGTIAAGFAGHYTYTAPSSIASVTKVTVTAKNHSDPSKSGVAVIQITPLTTVKVTPATAPVKVGATLALTAAVNPGDITDVRWAVYPIGAGTVAPDSSNPGKAVYTAPPAIGNEPGVTVVAYLVNDEVAGLGASEITLTT